MCADACLSEEMVAKLVSCIATNHDCADICRATGDVLLRQTSPKAEVQRKLLEACAAVCRACAEECEQHAEKMEHCRICAEACRRSEKACEALLAG